MADTNSSNPASPPEPLWQSLLKGLAALLVLAGFAFFLMQLLGLINADEKPWSRALYLYQSVEALAFASAGFLFGREVNRQRAAVAEQREAKADEKTQIEKSRADTQQALAAQATAGAKVMKIAIQQKQLAASSTGAVSSLRPKSRSASPSPATGAAGASASLDELAAMAESVFPNL